MRGYERHGAIAKPANGFLLFVPEGKAKSFTGQLIGGGLSDPLIFK